MRQLRNVTQDSHHSFALSSFFMSIENQYLDVESMFLIQCFRVTIDRATQISEFLDIAIMSRNNALMMNAMQQDREHQRRREDYEMHTI